MAPTNCSHNQRAGRAWDQEEIWVWGLTETFGFDYFYICLTTATGEHLPNIRQPMDLENLEHCIIASIEFCLCWITIQLQFPVKYLLEHTNCWYLSLLPFPNHSRTSIQVAYYCVWCWITKFSMRKTSKTPSSFNFLFLIWTSCWHW